LGPLLDELLVALPALFLERVHGKTDANRPVVRRGGRAGRGRILLWLVDAGGGGQSEQDETAVAHFRSLSRNLERSLQPLRGAGPDPHVESPRPDGPPLVGPEREVAPRDRKLHPRALARLQRDAAESLQLLHRPRDTGHRIADVHLDDLFAGTPAAVA